MKVKKYTGSTTQEVMYKLKTELGSDALILNTRTVKKKGLLGLFQKPVVEIVAAVDDENINSKNKKQDNKLDSINEELVRLRSLMENVNYNNSNKNSLNKRLDKYRRIMEKGGVEYSVATSILSNINKQVNIAEKDDDAIKKIINYNILEYLGPVEPIKLNERQKVIFFVGPTGVGKTTTLAKIAAHFVLEGDKKIGLITADTYRVAAVEQLKTYSDILKLPLKIIYEANEFYEALAGFRNMDIILVDTAGRNHKDQKQILATKELINIPVNKEVFLVLSAITNPIILRKVIESYNFFQECKIIFTKVDEAEGYGNILNTKFYANNSLSYFTTGQNVPDDIEIANIEKVASALIGEN